MIGDVLRALQPNYLKQVQKAVMGNAKGPATLNVTLLQYTATPTWEELKRQLPNQSPSKDHPSSKDKMRLFGAKEPVIKLYRDSASWCPYCQKVWIALEEKQVPYVVEKVDMRCYGTGKPSEFLKLQPNGNLPCAVLLKNENQVIGESDEILDVIDSLGAPNTPTLRPPQDAERLTYLCDDGLYNSLERRLFGQWMWWMTGVRKPEEYKQNYLEVFGQVDAALANGGLYFL
ncbi:MAG: glutathione S-transferase N-terminal domain-containing protein, partial [Pseudomonadota bacterium]